MPDSYELLGGQLHMFVTQPPMLPLTFNQYLLATEEPLLVHTGSNADASRLCAQLRVALGDKELRYVFVSHFESDECGGIVKVLDAFPSAFAVCSEVTARQLAGFGLTERSLVKSPGETLDLGDGGLSFVAYPSEMHLWEGLLAFEETRSILFSSDLIMRLGSLDHPVVKSDWVTEVEAISTEKIPDPVALEKMRRVLSPLAVRFVATGHGPALDVERR